MLLLIGVYMWANTTPRAPPVVWVVPSLVRVGQYDPPGGSTLAELYVARGECESFQVVIRSPSRKLTKINVSVADLAGSNSKIDSEGES